MVTSVQLDYSLVPENCTVERRTHIGRLRRDYHSFTVNGEKLFVYSSVMEICVSIDKGCISGERIIVRRNETAVQRAEEMIMVHSLIIDALQLDIVDRSELSLDEENHRQALQVAAVFWSLSVQPYN